LALTESFVDEGMHVVMADIDEQELTVQAQRLGESVRSVVTDVSDQASVERAAQFVWDTFGALHIAVNNAGIVNGGNSWELSLEEWHRVLDTNLWGVIHGVRAFVPRILASRDEGHVVNTSSMAAVLALPGIGPYTVAKHGVLGLSDVLRSELKAIDALVGVSVVMPGMIRTGMNPVGLVEPSTVARNVLDAMRRDRPYVFTDDHSTKQVEDRLQAILEARADVLA
jgi:NAD(P)-dependent dehydrogenase (short-subunit alcohol dehydrogenase family)